MENSFTRRAGISRRHFMKTSALFSLAAVTGGSSFCGRKSELFMAGAATADITPGPDVTLRGPIAGALHPQGVLDRLNARALVLDNGSERIGIVVCDVCIISREICDNAKELILRRTGIPSDRILISATHSHMAVRAIDLEHGEAHERYMDKLAVWIADAVEKAFYNLGPAKIGWGVGSKPEHCLNRLWFMKPGTIRPNPFGETTDQVVMGGFRDKDNAIAPSGPVDPDLSVLSVQHLDGQPMALLANYNIHYGVSGNMVSADYFGHYAREMEKLASKNKDHPPMVAIMSNGTSGDINAGGEPATLALSLAEETMNVLEGIKYHTWVPLVMEEIELEIGIRLPDQKRIRWAEHVLSGHWQKPADAHPWTEIYARNNLKLASWPPVLPFKFQAMRIGELGIAALPTESYAKTGLAIKKESPLKPTIIIGIANGYGGYLPTPEDHKLGGYSTWQTTSSFMETDAEPKIRKETVRLLQAVARG